MAEGDITIGNHYLAELLRGTIDHDTDTFKMALVNATPNIDTWENFDDVTGEISGSGYTAGGVTLASLLITEDDTNDRAAWDFADPSWINLATSTINNGVIYKSTGVSSTSVIVGWVEIATNSNGANYTVQVNANGLFLLAQG